MIRLNSRAGASAAGDAGRRSPGPNTASHWWSIFGDPFDAGVNLVYQNGANLLLGKILSKSADPENDHHQVLPAGSVEGHIRQLSRQAIFATEFGPSGHTPLGRVQSWY